MVELGDLWAGEARKLLLTFAVPADAGLGLAEIAELELRYVALPDFAEQTVTIPSTSTSCRATRPRAASPTRRSAPSSSTSRSRTPSAGPPRRSGAVTPAPPRRSAAPRPP